jgi:lipoprotein-releasing system permease protein
LIGFIGTIFGATLGVLFSMNIESIRTFLQSITGVKLFDPVIYFLTQLPSSVDFFEVIMIICISLLISLLATIYPAWRAAKLMPAEVLRYE